MKYSVNKAAVVAQRNDCCREISCLMQISNSSLHKCFYSLLYFSLFRVRGRNKLLKNTIWRKLWQIHGVSRGVFWLPCSLSRVSQLLWSRSALILQTWFSLSVFQAPQKMLATVFTWQIPPRPDRAHGRDALWIVDSSNLWSAFHMRPSELNALPLLSF